MRTLRVLVVEDDPAVSEINQQFVQKAEGFQVAGVARSVATAVEAVERIKPDLVLLDIYMPDGDGLAVLREIRRHGGDVDVIAVTAARNSRVVQELMRSGAVGYIIKPFKFERLAATLQAYRRWRNALEGSSSLGQAEIDRLRRMLTSPQEDELPKGLDQITLSSISELMELNRVFLTAEEVAERVGTSRVTARRYLEYLTEVGRAEVRLSYGAVGRPVRRYQWIDLSEPAG